MAEQERPRSLRRELPSALRHTMAAVALAKRATWDAEDSATKLDDDELGWVPLDLTPALREVLETVRKARWSLETAGNLINQAAVDWREENPDAE